MNPDQAGSATRIAVTRLGTAFLDCPRTLRRARELGLTGWACYVAGRGGALGDVRADTVAAAVGLIAPEAVRDGWAAAAAVLPPPQIAAQMLVECARWGAENLDDAPKVSRLVTLAESVVITADAGGLPLFAAWRAMPLPSGRAASEATGTGAAASAAFPGSSDPQTSGSPDPQTSGPRDSQTSGPLDSQAGGQLGPGARAAIALHLLAEHRAGGQLVALKASGLSPVQALLAGPEGEAAAVAFGWSPPYPEPGPFLRRRAWADAVADHLAGQALRGLEPNERAELVDLLNLACRHAGLQAVGPARPRA